jgi:hypothetical protein
MIPTLVILIPLAVPLAFGAYIAVRDQVRHWRRERLMDVVVAQAAKSLDGEEVASWLR